MVAQPGTPGAAVKNEDWIMRTVEELKKQIEELRSADPFTPMGITAESGGINLTGFLNSLRSNGSVSLTMDPTQSAFIVSDASGNPVARLGLLAHANPGNYGIEILYSGSWAQVGSGNVDWSNITNKPSSFTPSAHASTHASGGTDAVSLSGTQISGQVPQAAGSNYGYNHAVGGTSFFAAWFGNDSNFNFGTNTSTIRHKRNVRRHRINPLRLLRLKPVRYEKPANGDYVEYGLIAEQVLEAGLPELVQWMNGQVHGLRYDLLAVALLEGYQDLYKQVQALKNGTAHEPANWHEPEHKANNPPPFPEEPSPYEIQEDD